jgi:melibiose permease/lactose/raffinose/galactose permease
VSNTEHPVGAVNDTRNKWTFSIGTIGRDMVYTFVSMYLIFYLTEVLNLSDATLAWVATLIFAARLFDCVMDIVMGSIVDNTRTRWGQYKPWILIGCIASGIFTVLLFSDMGWPESIFIVAFSLIYLGWGLSWTSNDIPYWSLLPALTLDQKKREQFGAVAKIFATIGTFAVVVAIIPVTTSLGAVIGDAQAWFVFAAAIVVIMWLGQSVTLFGVVEPKLVVEQEKVRVRDVFKVVLHNDQLLWVAIAMVLNMTGYITTTTFGTYYFKYVYGDENMYTPFGAVLGVGQIIGYLVFPALRKRMNRKQLFTLAAAMMVVGYGLFFFAPLNMAYIAVCGLLLFIGQAFVILLMLVFIADTIDYGHWKLGRRNTAITFALQPFINKVGAALAAQIAAVTLILTGINSAQVPSDVSAGGLLGMKAVMLLFPLACIVVSYLIYLFKYKIDEGFYAKIISDLKERGQLM